MSTTFLLDGAPADDAGELELILDGEWSDEEAAELAALAEVLPPDSDLEGFARVHDMLMQARRGREERQPLDDLREALDATALSNEPLQDGTAAEIEFLQAAVAYAHTFVRAARQHAAYERLRLRIAAAQEVRARLQNSNRPIEAMRVIEAIAAAKIRLNERTPEAQYAAELAGHEKRVQMLADGLTGAGPDPEREAVLRPKVRDAEPEDHGGRRWPRRRARP